MVCVEHEHSGVRSRLPAGVSLPPQFYGVAICTASIIESNPPAVHSMAERPTEWYRVSADLMKIYTDTVDHYRSGRVLETASVAAKSQLYSVE